MDFSYKTRLEHLKKMTETQLDFLIIGGGITGAGIALDAITRGLGVGVVEMSDFSSGMSSRSSKVIEGGLNYLKHGQFSKFSQLAKERQRIHENAPHLTTPFKVMYPLYQRSVSRIAKARLSLSLYDYLGQVTNNQSHDVLSRKESLKREPYLKSTTIINSSLYLEYRSDDSRLTIEVLKRAADFGAYLANYTKVEKFLYDSQTKKIIGVRVRDLINQTEHAIYARRIINATGAWTENLLQLDDPVTTHSLNYRKSIQLVFDRTCLPLNNSFYFSTPENGERMYSAIIRDTKIYVGTTYTVARPTLIDEQISHAEMSDIIQALNQSFTMSPLSQEDVEASWSGIYALPTNSSATNYKLLHSASGLYSVLGGPLSSYRKIGEVVVNTVLRDLCQEYNRLFIKCRTRTLAIAGGEVGGSQGYQRYINEFIKIGVEKFHLPHRNANFLARRYGSNVIDLYALLLNLPEQSQLSDLDYIMLRYALEQEMCLHPLDFLARRSSYLYFDSEHACQIKEAVIDEMAKFYQWSPQQKEQLIKETNDGFISTKIKS